MNVGDLYIAKINSSMFNLTKLNSYEIKSIDQFGNIHIINDVGSSCYFGPIKFNSYFYSEYKARIIRLKNLIYSS